MQNDESNKQELSIDEVFADYYQGLLPLNGVGEIEGEVSEFQHFLVQRLGRASTAPSSLSSQLRGDDSLLDSLNNQDDAYRANDASYASTLSVLQCDDSLTSSIDYQDTAPPVQALPPSSPITNGQLVQSLDVMLP